MLSSNYRLRLEAICSKIVNGEQVELSEMIWADKLAKANRSAGEMLNVDYHDRFTEMAFGSIRTEARIQIAAAESTINKVSKPQCLWTHAIRGTEDAMTEKVTI